MAPPVTRCTRPPLPMAVTTANGVSARQTHAASRGHDESPRTRQRRLEALQRSLLGEAAPQELAAGRDRGLPAGGGCAPGHGDGRGHGKQVPAPDHRCLLTQSTNAWGDTKESSPVSIDTASCTLRALVRTARDSASSTR